jgi:hypothetical protein
VVAQLVEQSSNDTRYKGINLAAVALDENFRKSLLLFINRTAHIRRQCRKTTVLSCHRCLINSGVEKMNYL